MLAWQLIGHLLTIFFGAGCVYAAIRKDIQFIHIKIADGKEEREKLHLLAKDAHSRLDTHINNHLIGAITK